MWYSSPTIFQYLLRENTGARGSVRSNRKGMPIFKNKMSKREVEFQTNGEIMAVKWHDESNVHVLSTVHTSKMFDKGKLDYVTGESKIKPPVCWSTTRRWEKLTKWTCKTVLLSAPESPSNGSRSYFFHLIDIALLNVHIVHQQVTWSSYQHYRINLMRQLLEDHHWGPACL